ncbi:MAG: hypothetical protein WDO71_00300 [Bacteroidota bacterium]
MIEVASGRVAYGSPLTGDSTVVDTRQLPDSVYIIRYKVNRSIVETDPVKINRLILK